MDKASQQIAAAPAPGFGATSGTPTCGTPLRSRFAHDPDMADLVALFAREMPARLSAIEACWNGRDLNRLARLVHQLKGAGSGYGFPDLSTASGQLEATLRAILDDGENPASPRLRTEYAALVALCQRVQGD